MPSPRDVLTPDALSLLQTVSRLGSFAAAARALGLVPSAVTYRVRQIEEALTPCSLTEVLARLGSPRRAPSCCAKASVCSKRWTRWPTVSVGSPPAGSRN